MLFSIRDRYIPEGLRPNFARFVQKAFGAKAREIGWKPKAGEDEQIRLLRPQLLATVADKGEDKALFDEANALAQRYLDDPRAVDNDLVDAVLGVAAHRGDQKLFDRLHEGAKKSKDQVQRGHLIEAMSQFRDPAIVKQALGILLRSELDPRETAFLMFQDDRMEDVTFSFLKQNFDAAVAQIPAELLGILPFVAGGFCDETHRADVEAFFKDRVAKLTGGAHNLAQTLEGISLCSALREAHQASLTAFLKKY
jgi:alanyl aminopeptidase